MSSTAFDDQFLPHPDDVAQAQPKRRPYNASASLSEYGVFPECDAAPAAEDSANGARDDWRIDHTAGRPILVYQDCSVIEAEQAEYVLGLIEADKLRAAGEPALHIYAAPAMKECRHCGWMCAPNREPSKSWYPLAAPATVDSAEGAGDVALPRCPQTLIEIIQRYGDERADGNGASASTLAEIVFVVRQQRGADRQQRGGDVVSAFDAAVAAELPKVSTLEYNSHEICKHFAERVRAALAATKGESNG